MLKKRKIFLHLSKQSLQWNIFVLWKYTPLLLLLWSYVTLVLFCASGLKFSHSRYFHLFYKLPQVVSIFIYPFCLCICFKYMKLVDPYSYYLSSLLWSVVWTKPAQYLVGALLNSSGREEIYMWTVTLVLKIWSEKNSYFKLQCTYLPQKPLAGGFSKKVPRSGMGYGIDIVNKEARGSKAVQANANEQGCTLELYGKTTQLKTSHPVATQLKEIKPELDWKLLPYWLSFTEVSQGLLERCL